MALTTIKSFSDQIGVPPETLVKQLAAAGVADKSPVDSLTDEEKETLFRYLRAAHGNQEERKKITLKRKSTSQVTQSSRTGGTRTVQVEVRKKRTFVKRSDVEQEVETASDVVPEAETIEVSEPAAELVVAPTVEPVVVSSPVLTPEPIPVAPPPVVAEAPKPLPREEKKPDKPRKDDHKDKRN
jgi:translation initiation factor IF-2